MTSFFTERAGDSLTRHLKKKVKKALMASGCTAAIMIGAGAKSTIQVLAEAQNNSINYEKTTPLYTVKSGATTTESALLENVINNDKDADLENADLDASSIDLSGLNLITPSIQMTNLTATVAQENGETTEISQEALIVVKRNEYPTLNLKTDSITIPNDGSISQFLPENYISMSKDSTTNSLPALTIDNNVDITTDGYYTVTYKATNGLGNTTEKVLTVQVETPQWLIEQRQAEAEQQAYEEEQARIQQEKEEAEKVQKEAEEQAKQQETINSGLQYSGGSNPYSGGWSNCTYGAWQALYNARGISLPNLGNASEWYSNAASLGYSVSGTATAGGIAVYSGHVAYVDAVDGNMVHIVEGGFSGHYNERWVSSSGTGTKSIIGYINI